MITPLTTLQSFVATVLIIGFVLGIRVLALVFMRAHEQRGGEDED